MIECKIGLDKKATVVSVFCYFTWRQCFAAFSRETLKKRGINIYDVKGKSKKRSKGRETGIRLERERESDQAEFVTICQTVVLWLPPYFM